MSKIIEYTALIAALVLVYLIMSTFFPSFWEKTKGEPIALFTFWLVIFTAFQLMLLMRAETVAEKTANAAKESAEALPILEQAYFYISRVAHNGAIRGIIAGEPNNRAAITYALKNYGKTPAIIREIREGVFFSTDLSEDFDSRINLGQLPNEAVITNGIEAEQRSLWLDGVTVEQARNVATGKAWLVLRGIVFYDDIFGKRHETSFFWATDNLPTDPMSSDRQTMSEREPRSDKKYNYRK